MPESKGPHQCSAPVEKKYIPASRTAASAKTALRNAPRDSVCPAAAQRTPVRFSTTTARLSLGEAKRLAAAAGARDITLVASCLVLCTSRHDAMHSIEQLRRNRFDWFTERHGERGEAGTQERQL